MYAARGLLKLVDAVAGAAALRFMNAEGREKSPLIPKKILVIRPGGIGDFVLLLPMLKHINKYLPKTEIDVLCERRNTDAACFFPFRKVYLYDTNPIKLKKVFSEMYDAVINTEQFHSIPSFLAYFTKAPIIVGFDSANRGETVTRPVHYAENVFEAVNFLRLGNALTGKITKFNADSPFLAPDKTAALPQDFLKSLTTGKKHIGIFNGASYPQNAWAGESFSALCERLRRKGWKIVAFGRFSPPEGLELACRENLDVLNMGGRLDIRQTTLAISRLDAFVSVNSGLGHISYGVGTPTIFLRANVNKIKWTPHIRHCRTLNFHPAGKCSPDCGILCPNGAIYMHRIAPEHVMRKLAYYIPRS